ncbi:MAG TPA: hypothetical protein VG900_03545 [Hyphomicrobiaceae bacterium]|nr:hypothetical protein [Hyphomicrobiaceae bacterium]
MPATPPDLRLPVEGAARAAPHGALAWVKRESVALVGVAGASLTALGQLVNAMPMVPLLRDTVSLWQRLTHGFWRPPAAAFGTTLHPHIVASLTLGVFLLTIGAGARLAGRLRGHPSPRGAISRRLGDESWLSLAVFAALCIIFLIGHEGQRLVVWGSERVGGYAFAIPVAAGYIAGSVIGGQAFHSRMLRLGLVVVLLLAGNAIALWAME